MATATYSSRKRFVLKDWLIEDPDATFKSIVDFINNSTFQSPDAVVIVPHKYHSAFAKDMVLTTIFTTNKLEGTLSTSLSCSDTFRFLGSVYDSKDQENASNIHWRSDGGKSANAARVQLACHMQALKYITSQEILSRDLTVDDVLMVHKLMMANATEDDGTPLLSGVFRNVNVRASEHVYPPGDSDALRTACEIIVARFNSFFRNGECVGNTEKCFIEAASALFYDMITLHPFIDGNGRLCRLLVTYALRRVGFPFCIPLSSHHKKSRKHYMLAILECRSTGNMEHLNTLILTSMNYVMRNYLDNLRVMNISALCSDNLSPDVV
jgi:Fic family protein